MADLFRKANSGLSDTEESGFILQDPSTGKLLCFHVPSTKARFADQLPNYKHPWEVAAVHTHPHGRTVLANQGNDKEYPDKYGVPSYVLSRDGVHKYDPSTDAETTEVDNQKYRKQYGQNWFDYKDNDACGCH